MELTKIEKAIIESYRGGADLKINYYTFDNDDLEEAIGRIKPFGKVTSFLDLTDPPYPFVVVRSKEHENLQISAFLEVSRE